MTKKERILRHLRTHKSITSLEAIELYGATRLSGIIYDIKHRDNIDIATNIVSKKDRYGNVCYVAEYRMVDKWQRREYSPKR